MSHSPSHASMNHMGHDMNGMNNMNTNNMNAAISDPMPDHSMMKMYFHFGLGDTLLFKQFTINTDLELVISCFVFLVLAILYEGLKYYRQFVFKKNSRFYNLSTISNRLDEENLQAGDAERRDDSESSADFKRSSLNRLHFYQSILHVIQVMFSYTLMFGFMSFNICICFAILLGAGLGYFIFFKRKLPYEFINEHCN